MEATFKSVGLALPGTREGNGAQEVAKMVCTITYAGTEGETAALAQWSLSGKTLGTSDYVYVLII